MHSYVDVAAACDYKSVCKSYLFCCEKTAGNRLVQTAAKLEHAGVPERACSAQPSCSLAVQK